MAIVVAHRAALYLEGETRKQHANSSLRDLLLWAAASTAMGFKVALVALVAAVVARSVVRRRRRRGLITNISHNRITGEAEVDLRCACEGVLVLYHGI